MRVNCPQARDDEFILCRYGDILSDQIANHVNEFDITRINADNPGVRQQPSPPTWIARVRMNQIANIGPTFAIAIDPRADFRVRLVALRERVLEQTRQQA